jgi:hypothetical protein
LVHAVVARRLDALGTRGPIAAEEPSGRTRMRRLVAWTLSLAFVTTAFGCGDKDYKDSPSPDAAPSEPVDPSSPAGRWKGDMKQMIDMMKPMFEMMVKAAESMPAGDAASKEKVEDARKKLADIEKISMILTLRRDGTATYVATMPGEPEENGVGTWSQAGDQVTIVPKTVNGKPAEGGKAEPKTFTFKDNTLTITEGPMTIVFRRA